MKENVDLIVLRALPYSVFTMFVAIMLSMASLLIRIINSGKVSDSSIYQMDSNVYMICYFIMFVAIVLTMSFLYEISGISKWFYYSCTMSVVFALAEAINFVTRWAVRYINNNIIKLSLVVITEIIPSLCIVFMILFMINGIVLFYKGISKNAYIKKYKIFTILCIFAFVLQMLLSGMASETMKGGYSLVLFTVVAGVIYIYNAVVIYMLYQKIKRFCYDLYIHIYNSGR